MKVRENLKQLKI